MTLSQTILEGIDLGVNKPALDPIIIDVDRSNLVSKVESTHGIIITRLFQAGMADNVNIIFVAQPDIIRLFDNDYLFELCNDQYVGNNAYLLTVSAAGKKFLLPPWGMTWDEYILSLFRQVNVKPLRILAPWAQVRFEIK